MLTGSGSSSFSCNFFNAPFDSFIFFVVLLILLLWFQQPYKSVFCCCCFSRSNFFYSPELCFLLFVGIALICLPSARGQVKRHIYIYLHACIHTYIYTQKSQEKITELLICSYVSLQRNNIILTFFCNLNQWNNLNNLKKIEADYVAVVCWKLIRFVVRSCINCII